MIVKLDSICPIFGVNIKNIWIHHPDDYAEIILHPLYSQPKALPRPVPATPTSSQGDHKVQDVQPDGFFSGLDHLLDSVGNHPPGPAPTLW